MMLAYKKAERETKQEIEKEMDRLIEDRLQRGLTDAN